jgi:hypothetical protein
MTQQKETKYSLRDKRLPLLGSYTNRDSSGSKDQRFINIFPETRKVEAVESTRIYLNKRPGLTLYKNIIAGAGRGLTWFRNTFYIAIGNKIYEDGVTPTAVLTLTGSSGDLGMLCANSSTLGDYLFICDGTAGWIINSAGTVTSIVDVDFPTPHVPIPVFIDGYIILAKNSDLFNCVLDTPTSWNSGEYISAEMFPDKVVALCRQNNQVVALGESSTEFFYDAANASGSPLTRNDSTVIQMGCAFPNALYQNEQTYIFVSQSESGGRAIWQVNGFQPKKISDEFIDRILDAETTPLTCEGFGFRTMGHLFFFVSLTSLNRTFVYDVEEKLWHEWSSNVGNTHAHFSCTKMSDNHTGAVYLLHDTNGSVYKLDPTSYTDAGTSILCEVYTNKYDMDTYKRKFMTCVLPVADRSPSGNYINIRWTDDDYQTWSQYKPITLIDDFPSFARLGSFRRRAFNIKHDQPYALRLESLQVFYYEGDH